VKRSTDKGEGKGADRAIEERQDRNEA